MTSQESVDRAIECYRRAIATLDEPAHSNFMVLAREFMDLSRARAEHRERDEPFLSLAFDGLLSGFPIIRTAGPDISAAP